MAEAEKKDVDEVRRVPIHGHPSPSPRFGCESSKFTHPS